MALDPEASAARKQVSAGDPGQTFTGNDSDDVIIDSRFFAGSGDDTLILQETVLFTGDGDDSIIFTDSSSFRNCRAFSGGGADQFFQNKGSSASIASAQGGEADVPLTLTFAAQPDIIVDFQTAADAGGPADRIGFEGWGGPANFNDNRSSASGSFGNGNVVLYSGNFNATGTIFTTTNNNAGPDVLAFLSKGTGGSTSDFGDQAVVLLDASDQVFSADIDFL